MHLELFSAQHQAFRPGLSVLEVTVSDNAISAELPANVWTFFLVSLHRIPIKCVALVQIHNKWRDIE